MDRVQDLPPCRCVDCGVEIVDRRPTRGGTCWECACARQAKANTEMHYKQGPLWERIVRAQYKRWHTEMYRLGLVAEPYPQAALRLVGSPAEAPPPARARRARVHA